MSRIHAPDAAPLAAFLHSTRFALVDRSNRLRGVYDSADENDLLRLAADVQSLRDARSLLGSGDSISPAAEWLYFFMDNALTFRQF